MSEKYWDTTHLEKYKNSDWVKKSSIFSKFAVDFFLKTGKLLEIGTGQGGDANFFNLLGYEVTATDFSEEALRLAGSDFKNINFINLDTSKGLPFENESFDVVYSHMALHYFDKLTSEKVFKDIHRVLKPNGILATITNTMDDSEKETYNYAIIEPGFYHDPKGITKRYFSVDSMGEFTKDLFETIILDNKGETYKDDLNTLVRFIGKKK